MALLTKAAILAAGLKTERVAVPEWDGDVIVRELSVADREALEEIYLSKKPDALAKARAFVFSRCVVGEDGAELFSADDVARLEASSGRAANRVGDAALRLSGMVPEAQDALGKD
jgi:hypothetical protein